MELTHAQVALHLRSVETCRSILRRTGRSLLHRSGELRATVELYDGELHVPTSLYSSKQQGDIALKPHVASVYFKCFRCFRGMLQVFYMDVAKVDRDVV
jgi:hypothetical protein